MEKFWKAIGLICIIVITILFVVQMYLLLWWEHGKMNEIDELIEENQKIRELYNQTYTENQRLITQINELQKQLNAK